MIPSSTSSLSLGIYDSAEFLVVVFFFSSRRRHTRFDCDWSSDVCSSDLRTISHGSLVKSASAVAPAVDSSKSDSGVCVSTTAERRKSRGFSSGNRTASVRSEEHTSELQSQANIVCRLLLGKKKNSRLPSA